MIFTTKEPVSWVELPAELAFMPPWRWVYWKWRAIGLPGHPFPPDVEDRETAEATEEMRAALESAVAHLPEFYSPGNPDDPSRRMGR